MINHTGWWFYQFLPVVLLFQLAFSACHYSCFTCDLDNSATNCLTCDDTNTHRSLSSKQCICQVGYYDTTNSVCAALTCHYSCATCQTTATNCISCDSGNHRTLQSSTCPCDSGYQDNGNAMCITCPTTCQSCSGSNVCNSCDPTTKHRTLNSPNCDCSTGYFDAGADICSKCDSNCETCVTNSSNCLTCADVASVSPQRSAAPTCACPIERYYDDGLDQCSACDYRCLTCSDQSSCLTCSDTVDYRALSSTTGYCQCLPKYYETNTTICTDCDETCLTCDGAANTDCLSCKLSAKRQFESTTGKCVCQTGYYQTSATVEQCSACHSSCLTCSGGTSTDCLTCDSGKMREYDPASTAPAPAGCLCKDGYYQNSQTLCKLCHSSCLTCSAYTTCLTCKVAQNTSLLVDNSCGCLTNQYWNGTKCIDCDYSCSTCETSSTHCLSCPASSNRQFSATANTCKCKPKFYDNGVATCVGCSSIMCLTCNAAGSCLTCDSTKNRVLSGTSCICKDQFYQVDAFTQICSACHYSCATCSDGISCDTCVEFSHRVIFTAICECNTGYFEDPDTKLCVQCSYQCQQCSDQTYCTACNSAMFRTLSSDDFCPCDNGYYDNAVDQLCLSCLQYCQTCTNGTQCATCSATDYRVLSTVTKRCICQDKYYDTSVATCSSCHYSCKTCSGGNTLSNCLTCNSTALRYKSGNTCLCKSGYYDDTLNQQCKLCHYSCLTCTDGVSCATCDNGRTKNTFCDCPPERFYDDQITDLCHACQYSCLTCADADSCDTCDITNQRQIDPEGGPLCTCIDGYYDDGNDNQLCVACNFACLTCNSSLQCITCDLITNFRDNPSQMCPCINHYYSVAGQQICHECQYTCLTCTNGTRCKTCDANKHRVYSQSTKLCKCMDKFFDNNTNTQQCQACDYSCKTCSTSSVNCLSCNTAAKRYQSGTSCLCKQYFYDDLSNQLCLACHYSCATCSQSTSCDTCNSVDDFRVDDSTTGYCKCKQGYYDDGNNSRVCLECQPSCLQCLNDAACTDCNLTENRQLNSTANYLGVVSQFCVCLYGYFSPDDATPCSACHYSCEVCDGSTFQKCVICDASKERTFKSATNQCICNDKFYDDGFLEQCQPCSPTCKTCETDSTNCLTCYSPEQHRQLNVDVCECKLRFFDSGADICEACSYTCLTCSGSLATECLTCEPTDQRTFSSNQCLCNEGFFDKPNFQTCSPCDDSCQACDNLTSCSLCRTGEYRQLNSTANALGTSSQLCVCLYKYYSPASNAACQPCHYSCSICQGPTNKQCLYCTADAHRILKTKQCVCADKFYDNGSDELCSPCHDLCATCVGPTQTECSSCVPTIFYLSSDTTCYSICPTTYFGNTANYLCQPCSQHCLTCIDATHCTVCQANFPLYLNVCLEECPVQSTYENTVDNICVNCPQYCLTCESSIKCLSCIQDYFLDELYPLCFPCHKYCKGCFGPASNQCQSCQYPLYLKNNQCYNISCPYGQYVDSIKGCVDCSKTFPNSLTCNISMPFLCKQNYKLLDQSCVSCDESPGYQMSKSGKCAQICGDGLLLQLQCDDGNTIDGDGCSANCLREEGWNCTTNSNKKSVCELTGDVVLSLKRVYKYGGQNKIKLDLELNIPITLNGQLFKLKIENSKKQVAWEFYQNAISLSQIKFNISYDETIQKQIILMTYGQTGNRRLLLSLALSEQFTIQSYPPAQFYSQQKISVYNQISNTLNLLSIILMILCAGCFFFPKRMYFNSFTFAYIPAQIYVVFGLASESITDWIKSGLSSISYQALVYGLDLYTCCTTSDFFNYTTKISQNAGIVIIVLFALWFGYGILVLISRNCIPVNPKINMFYRIIIVTIQLCTFFHLSYSSINSLYNYSLTEGENPINVCIGIFLTVYLFAFMMWMWILGSETEIIKFNKVYAQNQNRNESRLNKIKESEYFFELDQKTNNQLSLNETQKDCESSRSNLQILSSKEKQNVHKTENSILPKYSPYKLAQQKYLKEWLIYDFVQNYRDVRFSKYFLPLAITKIFLISLLASVLQQQLFVMLIIIGTLHFLYLLFLIIVRPFKLGYTTFRHILLEIQWTVLYGVMCYYSGQSEMQIYNSDIQLTILYIVAVLLSSSIVLIVFDLIAAWRFEIWNRIEPCLVALRLRNPRKVLEDSQNFKKPERLNRKVEIINLQNQDEQTEENKSSKIIEDQKEQKEELDAFFNRMLQKQKLRRLYRRQRLLKNQKININ